MFGLGKKSKSEEHPLSDEQKQAIADSLAALLQIQMECAPVESVEVTKVEIKRGEINGKALGYVYGFVDAALQSMGKDIADVPVGIPILYHVLRRLFPGQEAAYMSYYAAHDRERPVMLGMMYGGQQFVDYFVKPDAKGAPMGFARTICGMEND